jgi:hypothetical protein
MCVSLRQHTCSDVKIGLRASLTDRDHIPDASMHGPVKHLAGVLSCLDNVISMMMY